LRNLKICLFFGHVGGVRRGVLVGVRMIGGCNVKSSVLVGVGAGKRMGLLVVTPLLLLSGSESLLGKRWACGACRDIIENVFKTLSSIPYIQGNVIEVRGPGVNVRDLGCLG
jgi:hypothetical protein